MASALAGVASGAVVNAAAAVATTIAILNMVEFLPELEPL
jgi:hypothetical protein